MRIYAYLPRDRHPGRLSIHPPMKMHPISARILSAALIENPDAARRPLVFDTRGGYKDYFRGHLPTAHHLEFDTLRGTDHGVPVQYLPADLTKALLVRAGIDK